MLVLVVISICWYAGSAELPLLLTSIPAAKTHHMLVLLVVSHAGFSRRASISVVAKLWSFPLCLVLISYDNLVQFGGLAFNQKLNVL